MINPNGKKTDDHIDSMRNLREIKQLHINERLDCYQVIKSDIEVVMIKLHSGNHSVFPK